jgi:carboxyl-terminal processing protease
MVEAVSLEDGIAYVRLSSFTGSAASQLKETLEEQLENEPKGLILDLRDNPGGFLNQSVEVADLFLPEGTVLFQRDNKGGEQIFESDDGDIAEEIPLVVLINRGSASASEIVAGAIQDRERGILIGESTFGKGSVQKTFTLSDGSELKVTISRWYTPDNISISEIGISPNIQVDTIELSDGTEDVQLQRAIEYLSAGS